MKPLHIQTPLLQSRSLQNKLGKQVYFKLEALQPSGSFKLRGIGRLCQKVCADGTKSLAASSGGNAGVAVAYCGMKLNKPTTIFIPDSSHQIYINAIRSYGADVIISGKTAGDAQIAAIEFAKTQQSAYIHPFDHPEIWQGHSTMIDEIVSQQIRPDVVIVSVGGGGLACGVLEGMHRHGWHNVPFIAVETVGADVFSQSIQVNHPVTLSSITSKATSLGSTYVTPKLMEWATKHPIKNIVVSDDQAELGSRLFASDQRLLVELASGASLSLVYDDNPVIHDYHSILVIICGGINTCHFNILR
ncbi:MAG: serine dehydratase [Legionellales bacterium RIFCSPHIGHO2_12_FULL_42_9]|nr:MAG: serine dehydratase [Legionellales bacterium RIFCSPHIGHO2_12_FULL_42_9]